MELEIIISHRPRTQISAPASVDIRNCPFLCAIRRPVHDMWAILFFLAPKSQLGAQRPADEHEMRTRFAPTGPVAKAKRC